MKFKKHIHLHAKHDFNIIIAHSYKSLHRLISLLLLQVKKHIKFHHEKLKLKDRTKNKIIFFSVTRSSSCELLNKQILHHGNMCKFCGQFKIQEYFWYLFMLEEDPPNFL